MEIHAHLKKIVEREGARIDDAGLSYIVKAAEGSMRDAQSLLDQIISFGGQDVGSEDVRDVLGFISNEILDRTMDSIAASNSQELIQTVAIVVDQGLGLQQFVRELIARMRDLLMMKLGLADKVLGSEEERTELRRRAESFSEQDLIRYFDLLMRLETDLRYTSQPRFHLEVGLVKLAKAGHMRDIEEVLRDLKQESPAAPPSGRPAPTSPPTRSSSPAATPQPRSDTKAPSIVLPPISSSLKSSTPMASAAAPAPKIEKPEAKASPEIREGRPTSPIRKADDSALSSAREEPLVKSFLEVFRGDIAQVKPPKGETP
jgi:DNA polymerase-3 subunit gamma/tau